MISDRRDELATKSEFGLILQRVLDGKQTLSLKCPGCGRWGHLDDDQAHGRVSTQHDCGYHETHDFVAALPAEQRDLYEDWMPR